MHVPIIALYGALNAILNVVLAARVSRARVRHDVSLGDADKPPMRHAIRTHANNAEYVPLALVMLLIAEISGGSSMWLHALGGTLFVARIGHAVGIPLRAPNPPRLVGTGATWAVIVATSVYCLVLRSR